ncbi:MAG: alpha-amylase family glycosyl hydrolase [Eubacteriales bacterium]
MEIFNPRNEKYKKPYGAVPTGKEISFTLYPELSSAFSGGELVANREGDQILNLPLVWAGREGFYDKFTVTLPTEGFQGLVWYYFRLTGIDGREQYIRPHSDPIHGVYQITVYQEEDVPSWFGEGMSYQIFPDRFHRSTIRDTKNMVGGRIVHKEWMEHPDYLPDENGEVRNRDFFGGDLKGITQKLDYLEDLGVETIYLCPIFEAPENHRYGTADYETIDPMLGNEEDFKTLCQKAHEKGMKIMLDGVFNHVGFVSRYFNGDNYYPNKGAYQSKESPYFDWFSFHNWPNEYDSWWGFYSLPSPDSSSQGYRNFIFQNEDSVVRRWLRLGADGWRLDVADELPDDFVAGIHAAARAEKPEAVVIGEVWEDGSTKEAYGVRRKHILGGHCDGLMNYPLRRAILDYYQRGSSENFIQTMETIRENYPKTAFYSAMNALGTHDTLRILTLLGHGGDALEESKTWRFNHTLSKLEQLHGEMKTKSALALLFAFPGSPCVYYGDEAGMQGFEDPFNRYPFPWGKEDRSMIDWVKTLGQLRKTSKALRVGDIYYLQSNPQVLAFMRTWEEEEILCIFNNFEHSQRLPLENMTLSPLAITDPVRTEGGKMVIPPYFAGLFRCQREKEESLPEETTKPQENPMAGKKDTIAPKAKKENTDKKPKKENSDKKPKKENSDKKPKKETSVKVMEEKTTLVEKMPSATVAKSEEKISQSPIPQGEKTRRKPTKTEKSSKTIRKRK